MKERCYNSNNHAFHRYGERGIRICEEWLEKFESFYVWAITNGYRKGLTIERTDNDGNYEPGNCRWATFEEQAQNKSTTRISKKQVAMIRLDNRPNLAIANELGVNESTISRIKARFTWKNV